MGKLDRILHLLEENNRLLRQLTGEPLSTSYGRNAHVHETQTFVSGARELAVLFPDDLEAYGDADNAS